MKAALESFLLGLVILAALLVPFPAPWAQPVRERVLDEVLVSETPDAWEVHVGLSFPARYERHFPLQEGTELRVTMQPLAVSAVDQTELAGRESVRPRGGGEMGLVEVTWEGGADGGPYVTFEFSRPVSFWVRQGKDFRSLVVTVAKTPAEGGEPAAPAPGAGSGPVPGTP
jgi:hypothetical protein